MSNVPSDEGYAWNNIHELFWSIYQELESAGMECNTPATLAEVMEIASRYVPVTGGPGERSAPGADCCN